MLTKISPFVRNETLFQVDACDRCHLRGPCHPAPRGPRPPSARREGGAQLWVGRLLSQHPGRRGEFQTDVSGRKFADLTGVLSLRLFIILSNKSHCIIFVRKCTFNLAWLVLVYIIGLYAVSITFALVFQFGTVGIDLLWHTLEYILWLRRRSDGSQSQPWEGNKCCVNCPPRWSLCLSLALCLDHPGSAHSNREYINLLLTLMLKILDIKYTLKLFVKSKHWHSRFYKSKTQTKICPIWFRRGSILTPCSLTKIMADPQRANFCINFQRLQFVSFMFFTMYFFCTNFFLNIYFHLTMLSKFYRYNCCHLPSFVFQHKLESWCYCELIMHAKQNILLSRKQGKKDI